MNKETLFKIEGLKNQSSDAQVMIVSQTFGLKMINAKDFTVIHYLNYYDERILFDWQEKDREKKIDGFLYFLLIYDKHEYKICGTLEQISNIRSFCQGKFIFRQNDIYIQNAILEQGKTFQICQVTNKMNGKKYIQKKILQEFNSEEISCTNITDIGTYQFPEEIRIIQALNMFCCPYLNSIESINYDGLYYSYIYETQKLLSLKQFFRKYRNPPISFIIEIVQQILQVLLVFQELKIVHNGISMDNIFYSQATNTILISDFSYSFFETQHNQQFKGNSVGFISPEFFAQKQIITTQANVYQVGILLYYMLFSENPFGKDQVSIFKNNIKGEFHINNTSLDSNIIDLLKSMMQKEAKKRKTPEEYLRSKLFSPAYKERVSKISFLNYLSNIQPVEEENPNIQQIKQLCINKMKK